MATNLRRYKFNFGNVISCGAGISGDTAEYNILNGFSFTSGNTVCEYPTITTSDLSTISTGEYKKRIKHLLYEINVENPNLINNLLEESQIENPDGVLCKLNKEFLVYPFFSGVRIINVGEAIGDLEYKAFPENDNPDDYIWQKNGTFLNLNNNSIYIFQVRDVLNGVVRCMVEKRVSLPLLVPSTIIIPAEKSISIRVIKDTTSPSSSHKSGCIFISPKLENEESVGISYTISSNAGGDSTSSVKLCCIPNGSTTYSIIENVRNNDQDNTKSNSLIINSGDVITYSLNSKSNSVGSNGFAFFQLSDVSGEGSTDPIIDSARCCVNVSSSIASFNTVVNLTGQTYTSFSNYRRRCGNIYLDPDIPTTTSVSVDVKTCVITENGGGGYVNIKQKPRGETTYDNVIYNTQSCIQPQTVRLNIENGDDILFITEGSYSTTNTNSSGCAIIELVGSTGSTGIGTTINNDNFIDGVSRSNEPRSIVASVCRQNITTIGTYGSEINGFINLNPQLKPGEGITITSDIVATISDSSAFSRTALYCKPYLSSGFIELFSYESENINTIDVEEFTMNYGDQICYTLRADSYGDWITGTSSIKLTNIDGSSSLSPSINTNKSSDIALANRIGTPDVINVNITGETIISIGSNLVNGSIVIDPEISSVPYYNYLDVELTTNASSCLNGSAYVCVFCKPNGSENRTNIFVNTNKSPQVKVVRIRPGDEITYSIRGEYNNSTLNSCGCASLTISDLESPKSILPSIGSSSTISACAQKELKEVVVSLNVLNESTTNSCGIFSLSEGLNPTERITIDYTATVNEEIAATSYVFLYCKPYLETSYTPFMQIFSNSGDSCNGTFDLKYGDSVCYTLCAQQYNVMGSKADAILDINSLSGSLSINPLIDNNNCCDVVSVVN